MARRIRGFVWAGIAAFAVAGCNPYPEVADGESVELIAALRTACSSKRADRLDRTVAAIESRRSKGELSDDEYESFQKVVEMARAGQWELAEKETYRFQKAQVR